MRTYISLIKKYQKLYEFRIYCYCLMDMFISKYMPMARTYQRLGIQLTFPAHSILMEDTKDMDIYVRIELEVKWYRAIYIKEHIIVIGNKT